MATPLTNEEVQKAADEYRAIWWVPDPYTDDVYTFANEADAAEWVGEHQQIKWDDDEVIEQTCVIGEPCEACT